jgi:hypothetical protein
MLCGKIGTEQPECGRNPKIELERGTGIVVFLSGRGRCTQWVNDRCIGEEN